MSEDPELRGKAPKRSEQQKSSKKDKPLFIPAQETDPEVPKQTTLFAHYLLKGLSPPKDEDNKKWDETILEELEGRELLILIPHQSSMPSEPEPQYNAAKAEPSFTYGVYGEGKVKETWVDKLMSRLFSDKQ